MISTPIKSLARRRAPSLPGLVPTTAFSVIFLGLVVALPVLALVVQSHVITPDVWLKTLTSRRVLAAMRVSFGTSAASALVTSVIGLLLAWVLERYRFTGRRVLDALLDIPLALPTAVAGLALAAIYAENGSQSWLGGPLKSIGLQVAYTPLGIIVAQVFVTLPVQTRALQPLLRQFDSTVEDAGIILGASPWQRFWRLFVPHLSPALICGFTQAFARALGEYGAIIFIAGNLPGYSEIVPLIIATKLEQFDYAGASALALIMLAISFASLLILNLSAKNFGNRLKEGFL